MRRRIALFPAVLIFTLAALAQTPAPSSPTPKFEAPSTITGFSDPAAQLQVEREFLRGPEAARAGEHLRVLTSAPHLATTAEGHEVAKYILKQFKDAGLDARIEEYKVYFGLPRDITVEQIAGDAVTILAPKPERVKDDPFQNDPRILTNFNGFSASGDVTAEVVYVNYGRPEDFDKLQKMGIDVKGKIVLARYGENFRGVKAFVAQQRGAAGLLIYSDPWDDGYFKGDKYPKGPYRPDSGVQRGDIHYIFEYPGDPTTPGIGSVPTLPDSQRTPPEKAASLPRLPSIPISYADATPILQSLEGPVSPRDWQGALPFTYHVGPGPLKVRMAVKVDYAYRTIWNVIGTIKGSQYPDELVVAGNHHDAWVYGAVDPSSGTAAMLEAVNGIGKLLKSGWRPKRTIVFAAWDAEEQGLIGSTEWAEQHAKELESAAAYFNVDVAVAGPNFSASAIPSLKDFMRELAKAVPTPGGVSVYESWADRTLKKKASNGAAQESMARRTPVATGPDVPVGDLGSGSDYTVFLQHLGVPASDMSSGGPYGVYHSVFDNMAWFKKFADPDFAITQQMARVFGVGVLRFANADVLPLDYEDYGAEIGAYIDLLKQKASANFGDKAPSFDALNDAARRLKSAGNAMQSSLQSGKATDVAKLNAALRNTERAFLGKGLPNRPWFRHMIYAPGEYTGYAAVVLPGISEAIDARNIEETAFQISETAAAVNRAAEVLEGAQGLR